MNETAQVVEQLKTKADAYHEKKAVLDARRREFEEQEASLIEETRQLKEKVSNLQEHIAASAKNHFRQTGEKKLWRGIGIREITRLDYDPERAFAFAKEKDMFLALDTKAFEKAAPSMGLDFVMVEKHPQVTFPKELKA